MLMVCGSFAGAATFEEARRAGRILEADRRWSEAAAVYEAALRDLPTTAPAARRFWLVMSVAEVWFEARDYSAARRWLTRAVPVDDVERARLLNASGTLRLVEGNLSGAARELARAVELSPGGDARAGALHNLAAVEMHTGRTREAIKHEEEALELWRVQLGGRHPYVLKAWVGLSSAHALAGDWQAAAKSLEEALRIEETPEALANYAVVLEKLKRANEAAAVRRRVNPVESTLPLLIDVQSRSAPIRTR